LADGKNRFTLIVLLCVLSGVYLFVFSDSGLLERMNLERKNRELLANIGKLRGEKSSLEESLRSYEAGRVPDRDVLNAGMVGGGDRLVFLDDRGQKTAMETRKEKKTGDLFNRYNPLPDPLGRAFNSGTAFLFQQKKAWGGSFRGCMISCLSPKTTLIPSRSS